MVTRGCCAGPVTEARRKECLLASLSGDSRRTNPRQELLVLLYATADSFSAHVAHRAAVLVHLHRTDPYPIGLIFSLCTILLIDTQKVKK